MNEELTAKQKQAASGRVYYEANREKVIAATRAWGAVNPEKLAASKKMYHEANRAAYNERTRSHQAAAANRRPSWYDRAACVAVYQLARDLTASTGIPHEVDHIIPLQGEMVSGLHVAANLQVLTTAANRLKHNRFLTV